jgi:SPP1 family predicted phage head-tail adaptor
MSEAKTEDIGLFDKEAILLCPKEEKSATGDRTVKYIPQCPILGNLTDNTHSSARVDETETETRKFVFTTWYNPLITTDWMLQYQGKDYRIERITELEDNLYAKMECKRENVENGNG